jgi:multidrug efflux pump subunit AcrA (membrane-fusion protein)
MKKNISYAITFLFFAAASCKSEKKEKVTIESSPVISNQGKKITLLDTSSNQFFATETINATNVSAQLTAPAKVAASVVPSQSGAGQNIVLFDNPELAGNYSELVQHQLNIKQKQNIIEQKELIIRQKQIELDRFIDLAEHGAGTGKDVSDARTDLIGAQTDLRMAQNEVANEQTGLIEQEARLKQAGFDPRLLRRGGGRAFIICDIPENQISKIKEGSKCRITFTSFPNESFSGQIADVADVVDNVTRMVKLLISITNPMNKFRAGMFATVVFRVNEGKQISIPNDAVATVQGKNYVFTKTGSNTYERREVTIGEQIGDSVIVYSGLQPSDAVAIKGVMQLKGLSFGY